MTELRLAWPPVVLRSVAKTQSRSSSTYTRKRSRRGSGSLCSEAGGPWPVASALATTLDFAGSFYVYDRPGPVAVSRSGQPRPRAHCLGNSLDSGGPGGRFFDGRAMALEAHGRTAHGR